MQIWEEYKKQKQDERDSTGFKNLTMSHTRENMNVKWH